MNKLNTGSKKMKKSIVSLMVFGMTLSGAAGVYAGTNMQKITAYLNHSIGIKVNGAAYTPADSSGRKLAPITYNDTTYLPVRAVAGALNVPVTYDSKNKQVLLGKGGSPATGTVTGELVNVTYSDTQIKAMKKEFARFQSFETAYAPKQMSKGDVYQKAGATEDGVNLVFKHMNVNISPRDYSDGYASRSVKLSSGIQAKWYTPGDTAMLGFKLDDRIVTISSPDHSLSAGQIEKIAVSVAKVK